MSIVFIAYLEFIFLNSAFDELYPGPVPHFVSCRLGHQARGAVKKALGITDSDRLQGFFSGRVFHAFGDGLHAERGCQIMDVGNDFTVRLVIQHPAHKGALDF